MTDELEKSVRYVAVRDGAAVAFTGAAHELWSDGEKRFGVVRSVLRNDAWNDGTFERLTNVGEEWLRSESAKTSVARVREDFVREIAVLERIGYREDRRMRISELDLVARRDHIMETAAACRTEMHKQGVHLRPLSDDPDPDKFVKLFHTMTESERDIPRTVPWRELSFEEWMRHWFDNPTIRADRWWIAREGDQIVGTSVLDCPVERGVPWTEYTGTLGSVRGRGIAKALKYESMAQAIESGYARVRTNNDADNPPILHINAQMGYHLISPVIELHRDL
jgi:RimJ/RimL family protein N-acetyltransferase